MSVGANPSLKFNFCFVEYESEGFIRDSCSCVAGGDRACVDYDSPSLPARDGDEI